MNAHDLIVRQVLNSLTAAPALAGGNVWEEELRPLPEGSTQAIVVRFESSRPDRGAILGAPIDWVSTLTVECHARVDNRSATLGRASRRLHGEVYARLMADPSLGGKVFDLQEPDLATDQAQLDTDLGCLIAQYPVLHRTQARTLEVAA